MTRLKNGNEQESRAAPKWKRWLPTGIAFLLIIAFSGILFYNIAFAATENYRPNGSATFQIKDPSGTASKMTINFSFCGSATKFKTAGDKRKDFKDSSHHIQISAHTSNGAMKVGICKSETSSTQITTQKLWTSQDNKDGYCIITFYISFLQPSHTFTDNYDNDVITSGTGPGRYQIDNFSKISHSTDSAWKILKLEINLSNVGMITDTYGAWHSGTADMSVKLKKNSYTLTCKPDSGTFTKTNGGSKSGDNVVFTKKCGEKVTSLPTISRSGYHFDGWYNSSNKAVTEVTLCNGNQTVTAHWTKEYTLTFNANGGSPTPKSKTLTSGSSYGTLDDVTRTGYKFNGWYTAASGGTKVDSTTKISANTTLYAQWTAYRHNIVYDLQGGVFPSNLKKQSSVNGCKIIPNGVYYMKSDCGTNMYMHVYKVAYEHQSDPATVIYTGKGSSTQAQWIFERYKDTQYYYIISVLNGLALSLVGNPPDDLRDKPVELWNQSIGSRADDFLWYLVDEGNGKVSICNKATNQSLDVKSGGTANNTWIRQYDSNHQAAQRWTLETASQEDYPSRMKYGDHRLYVNTIEPERNNHEFFCWNTKPDGTGKSYNAGDAYNDIRTDGNTVTLYALYDVDDFTLNFNANGGTGKINSITHKGNQSYALPANTFTRKGYEFRGWSLDKYTDTISYKNEGTYDNRLISATLYAQWKKNGTGFIQRPFLDADMFYKVVSILGDKSTVYNKNNTDSRMAHIDAANDPGYFSLLK